MSMKPHTESTVAEFLLRRLSELGCDHIFGVPGDFVFSFLSEVLKHDKIKYIGTCNELNAAYAADGYARIKGIGCVTTTYGVGELSAINGLAGAFAENVPVVHIVGCPAAHCYNKNMLIHHTFGDYEATLKIYQHVTAAQTLLITKHNNSAMFIANEIDRVLHACVEHQLPVYIGVASDLVRTVISVPSESLRVRPPTSDPHSLNAAISDVISLLNKSRFPLFIPGMEIARRRLESDFCKLLEASGFPFVTMMLSKAIVTESHPQFLGNYAGQRTKESVMLQVKKSDCVLILGEKLTDLNTGGFTTNFNFNTTVEVKYDFVKIGYRTYPKVYIHDFINALASDILPLKKSMPSLGFSSASEVTCSRKNEQVYNNKENDNIEHRELMPFTFRDFLLQITQSFQPNSVVISDVGAPLFSLVDIPIPQIYKFISQCFYGSIGYSVGGALGICMAEPAKTVYLIIGDGAFQAACQDISSIIRYNCKLVVFLINNDGYSIERAICDNTYNDIQPWRYHQLPFVFGEAQCFDCRNAKELHIALEASTNSKFSFIEIHLNRLDLEESLFEIGRKLAVASGICETNEN